MNSKLPRLDKDQSNFIIEHLAAGTPMKAIVSEFLSMFPAFGSGSGFNDEEISHRIYQRIQKIKEKRINEIEALRDADLSGEDAPYLSAQWRARRLYSLLLNAENKDPKIIQLQIRIIKEMRAEAELLNKNNDKGKIDNPPLRDLVSELGLDPNKFENSDAFGESGIKRLSDGVHFNANGYSYSSFRNPNSEDISLLSGKGATVWDAYDTNDPCFWEDEESDDDTQVKKQDDVEDEDKKATTDSQTIDASADTPHEPDNTDGETDETDIPFDETKPTSAPGSEPDVSDFIKHPPSANVKVMG